MSVYIAVGVALVVFVIFALRALRRESRYIESLSAERARVDEREAQARLYGRSR